MTVTAATINAGALTSAKENQENVAAGVTRVVESVPHRIM